MSADDLAGVTDVAPLLWLVLVGWDSLCFGSRARA
jgi:hypothetical protein